MADSMTQILKSGPAGTKLNIAVLGDGFSNADQTEYNDKVNELLLDGVFGHDYFYEDAQAFNIYRVNLISNDSGVSQRVYDLHGTPNDSSDDTIISTTIKDTALGIIYNGSWAHCWLEWSSASYSRVQNALDTWVPDQDLVVIILNESGFGGCGGGGYQTVTLGSDWTVMAHEFGHGTGDLLDEYCVLGSYTYGEPPSAPNVTINTNRSTVKWNNFINTTTPVPTGIGSCSGFNQSTKPTGWNDSQDVGLFEGGATFNTGIYRPAINCRMRGNAPPYCPVCYTHLKTKLHPYTGRSFLKCCTGDFNGDGKDDLLVHNGNSMIIYRSDGSKLDLVFSIVEKVSGSWYFAPNDQLYVGDFNGDGKDELVVYNSLDWKHEILGLLIDDGNNGLKSVARYYDKIPGWQFAKTDKFYVADFDGDGRDDLFVFNGSDWSIPYFGMLSSNASSFSVVQRYDDSLASWQMRPQDHYYVGDFNGNGKDDLWVFNGDDWSDPYLGMLESNGNSLSMTMRYDRKMPGWQMRPEDQHYVGDFNGDRKDDLFVFNGHNWSMAYLGMFKSSGSDLSMVIRHDGNTPGWRMRKNDRHYIADVNGDGRSDLFVYNCQDWSYGYLGTLVSNGRSLSSSWKERLIGEWNLGSLDMFEPCNYEGLKGTRSVPYKRDLIVHNQNWLGMIRKLPGPMGLRLQKIYYKWIHNYHYGRNS